MSSIATLVEMPYRVLELLKESRFQVSLPLAGKGTARGEECVN